MAGIEDPTWDGPVFGTFGVLDDDGEAVQCHVCGDRYGWLSSHIRRHGLGANEYREAFGLARSTRLISRAAARRKAEEATHLAALGEVHRFVAGDPSLAERNRERSGRPRRIEHVVDPPRPPAELDRARAALFGTAEGLPDAQYEAWIDDYRDELDRGVVGVWARLGRRWDVGWSTARGRIHRAADRGLVELHAVDGPEEWAADYHDELSHGTTQLTRRLEQRWGLTRSGVTGRLRRLDEEGLAVWPPPGHDPVRDATVSQFGTAAGLDDEQYEAWVDDYLAELDDGRFGVYARLAERWGLSPSGARDRIARSAERGLVDPLPCADHDAWAVDYRDAVAAGGRVGVTERLADRWSLTCAGVARRLRALEADGLIAGWTLGPEQWAADHDDERAARGPEGLSARLAERWGVHRSTVTYRLRRARVEGHLPVQ